MTGNTKLIEYGIQNEQSDLRAHVCVLAEKVYVYRTVDGISAMQSGKYRSKPAYTADIVTAWGYIVPALDIPSITWANIPRSWLDKLQFSEMESTSSKGEKAIKVVKGLLNRGYFPLLPLTVTEIEDTQLQISGADIHVTLNMQVSIQVKCDYRGGVGDGCTGNLYLQTAECNPFQQR